MSIDAPDPGAPKICLSENAYVSCQKEVDSVQANGQCPVLLLQAQYVAGRVWVLDVVLPLSLIVYFVLYIVFGVAIYPAVLERATESSNHVAHVASAVQMSVPADDSSESFDGVTDESKTSVHVVAASEETSS